MLKIVEYPDPILRKTSQKIENPTDFKTKQLISDMLKLLRSTNDGLGLSAPQVGKNLQLCIIEIENEVFTIMNPKIEKLWGSEVVREEGCLSFPGKFLPVKRSEKIKITATDANGKKQVIRARGLLSRALQHEIDHLHGVLFVDRAVSEVKY